jgi:ABC-2 type transporter
LQALPTKDGENFLISFQSNAGGNADAPARHLTPDEFHTKFYDSDLGKKILEELDTPVEISKTQTELVTDEIKQFYGARFRNSSCQSLKLLIQREFILWWRDKVAIYYRVGQDLIMGLITGTLFWQAWEETSSVLGILFQSMFFISIGAMMSIPGQYVVRAIVYKQQDANFFPTWTYIVGRSLASIPASVIDGLLYGTIIYWFVGLAFNDGASVLNYIMFILITMTASIGMGMLFSVFSAITRDKTTGAALMSTSILLLILFSGFTVRTYTEDHFAALAFTCCNEAFCQISVTGPTRSYSKVSD